MNIIAVATLVTLLIAVSMPSWRSWGLKYSLGYVASITVAVMVIYQFIGASSGLHSYQMLQAFNQKPTEESYAALQGALSEQLAHEQDPLSHLLQARLYFAKKEYAASVTAFEQAYQGLEKDEGVLVEYATAVYFNDNQDARLSALIAKLNESEDMSLAAHSLLANIAMDKGDKRVAKAHWKQVLDHLPADSEQREFVKTLLARD